MLGLRLNHVSKRGPDVCKFKPFLQESWMFANPAFLCALNHMQSVCEGKWQFDAFGVFHIFERGDGVGSFYLLDGEFMWVVHFVYLYFYNYFVCLFVFSVHFYLSDSYVYLSVNQVIFVLGDWSVYFGDAMATLSAFRYESCLHHYIQITSTHELLDSYLITYI